MKVLGEQIVVLMKMRSIIYIYLFFSRNNERLIISDRSFSKQVKKTQN